MRDDSRPNYNRRVGTRVRIEGAPMRWRAVVPRKRFGRKRPSETADLVDLSITGASIRAHTDARIGIGDHVVIEANGGVGVVEVRRIQPVRHPDEAVYGVEFLQKDDGLTKLINDTLEARRPQDVEWRWNLAR
jgi:hypothetical protein